MPRLPRIWIILLWVSRAYLAVLALSVAIWFALPSFEHARDSGVACFWTDALVFYVKCEGFTGDSALQFILNVPLQMLYLPFFGLYSITDPTASMKTGLYMLSLGLLYWIAPLFLVARMVVDRIERRRLTHAVPS